MALDINAMTTREGVIALRDMVSRLNQAAINLNASAATVESVINAEAASIGPYQKDYQDMIAFARVAILDASGDIDDLKKRLSAVADSVENWLDAQRPSGGGADTGWPAPPVDVKKKGR